MDKKNTGRNGIPYMGGLTQEEVDAKSPEEIQSHVEEQIKLGINLAGILFKKVAEASRAVNMSPVAVLIALGAVEKMTLNIYEREDVKAEIKKEADEIIAQMQIENRSKRGPQKSQ